MTLATAVPVTASAARRTQSALCAVVAAVVCQIGPLATPATAAPQDDRRAPAVRHASPPARAWTAIPGLPNRYGPGRHSDFRRLPVDWHTSRTRSLRRRSYDGIRPQQPARLGIRNGRRTGTFTRWRPVGGLVRRRADAFRERHVCHGVPAIRDRQSAVRGERRRPMGWNGPRPRQDSVARSSRGVRSVRLNVRPRLFRRCRRVAVAGNVGGAVRIP